MDMAASQINKKKSSTFLMSASQIHLIANNSVSVPRRLIFALAIICQYYCSYELDIISINAKILNLVQ